MKTLGTLLLVIATGASAQGKPSLVDYPLDVKTAVKLAAEITGGSKNTLYDAALALKRSSDGTRNS